MENYKYFGILKDFDFEKINRDNFQVLIERDLFDVCDLSKGHESKEDYFGLELDGGDWIFSDFFLYNRKEYHLKKEVYLEMYLSDKKSIEECADEESHIQEIDYEIEKEFQSQNKLTIIEHYYRKYFSAIKNKELYLLYKNNTSLYKNNNFSEYYRREIEEIEDFICVTNYLQGKNKFYNVELKEVWELMFLVSKVCDFCMSKKQLIENPIQEIKTTTLAKENFPETVVKNDYQLVFKNDGHDIFNFLVSKYSDEKNKAFFSYLYSFLLKNDKIIKPTKDNQKYRDFIFNHFGLKMSKLIQTVSNNPDTENERFETFSNYMKTYSVNY